MTNLRYEGGLVGWRSGETVELVVDEAAGVLRFHGTDGEHQMIRLRDVTDLRTVQEGRLFRSWYLEIHGRNRGAVGPVRFSGRELKLWEVVGEIRWARRRALAMAGSNVAGGRELASPRFVRG